MSKMKRKMLILAAAIFLLISLSACNKSTEEPAGSPASEEQSVEDEIEEVPEEFEIELKETEGIGVE